MRLPAPTIGVLVFGIAFLTNAAYGGSLRKVWDFELRDSPGVFGLSFSRDGQRIAVIAGHSLHEESVLLLDSRHPQAGAVQLDINPQLSGGDGRRAIEWSPSGQEIIFATRIVRIPDGTGCSLPIAKTGGKFVGPAQVAGYNLQTSRIEFYDLECRALGAWETPEHQRRVSFDASAERGLIFITDEKISNFTVTRVSKEIIDVRTQKAVRKLPTWNASTAFAEVQVSFHSPQFADSGMLFCGTRGDTWHTAVACSAVEGGQTPSATRTWYAPEFRTALRAPRIVISDYSRKFDFIDFVWYSGAVRKRVVWDFRSGKELVRWKPKMQKC